MSYKIEFPDYDDVINLPLGWKDISWHNNTCPSISKEVNEKTFVVIWCDYKDFSRRESMGRQFVVSSDINDGYTPQGEFDTFENALLFANALFSQLVVKG